MHDALRLTSYDYTAVTRVEVPGVFALLGSMLVFMEKQIKLRTELDTEIGLRDWRERLIMQKRFDRSRGFEIEMHERRFFPQAGKCMLSLQ